MKRLLRFFGEVVIICLGIIALWALVYHALAHGRSVVEFELCHLASGEKTGPLQLDGPKIKGHARIFSDQIMMVIPLVGDKCAQIIMPGREQAYVVGSYRSVLCKLAGGQDCEHADDK